MTKTMKKMPAFLLAGVIAVAFAFAIGTVTAQKAYADSYDLYVGGVQVTDANAGEIPGVESGKASYDAETKTLTLDGANITGVYRDHNIDASISDFKIELKGENKLSGGNHGISCNEVTITGAGSLEVNTTTTSIASPGAITIDGTTVTAAALGDTVGVIYSETDIKIKDSTVNVYSKTNDSNAYGIHANGTIEIEGSSEVHAESGKGFSGYAFFAKSGITIGKGLFITDPSNGKISDDKQYIVSGSWPATSVTIEPAYNLWVGGVQVTKANAKNIPGVVSGKASYDAATKTLTLDGATITRLYEGNYNIFAEDIPDLRIELNGVNNLSGGSFAISCNGVTITGAGSLEVNATTTSIFSLGDITIDGTTVTATAIGNYNGVIYSGTAIKIKGSTVNVSATADDSYPYSYGILAWNTIEIEGSGKVHASGKEAIFSCKGITICKGLFITDPSNGRISNDTHSIVSNGQPATSVTIEPIKYDLWVGGVQVDSANAENIPGVDSGKASYDPETKTLTLDGANITGLYDDLSNIYADIPGFKIKLKGKNKLSGGWDGIDAAGGGVTITGGGSLEVRATTFGIYSPRSAITIDGATVTAVGTTHDGHGIFSADAITIKGSSKVHAEGQTGAIAGVSGITIGAGLAITAPENGSVFLLHLFPDTYMIVDQHDTPATSATIEPVYTITLAKTTHGKAALSTKRAAEGTKVMVTATPDKGYLVDKMTYTDKNGKTKTIPSSGVITMPASNITVTVTFKKQKASPTPKIDKAAAKIALDAGLKAISSGSKVTASWGAVKGASSYVIYANYCDQKKLKKIRTVSGKTTSFNITKLNGKKFNPKKNLKFYVVAYTTVKGKKVKLAKSIMAHAPGGKNSKRTNVTGVKVKKASFTLKKGKTAKIKAKLVLQKKGKKPLKHCAKFRYASSNKKVAKVSKKGKITAVGKGKCTVYVYAVSGVSKKIKVTVK